MLKNASLYFRNLIITSIVCMILFINLLFCLNIDNESSLHSFQKDNICTDIFNKFHKNILKNISKNNSVNNHLNKNNSSINEIINKNYTSYKALSSNQKEINNILENRKSQKGKIRKYNKPINIIENTHKINKNTLDQKTIKEKEEIKQNIKENINILDSMSIPYINKNNINGSKIGFSINNVLNDHNILSSILNMHFYNKTHHIYLFSQNLIDISNDKFAKNFASLNLLGYKNKYKIYKKIHNKNSESIYIYGLSIFGMNYLNQNNNEIYKLMKGFAGGIYFNISRNIQISDLLKFKLLGDINGSLFYIKKVYSNNILENISETSKNPKNDNKEYYSIINDLIFDTKQSLSMSVEYKNHKFKLLNEFNQLFWGNFSLHNSINVIWEMNLENNISISTELGYKISYITNKNNKNPYINGIKLSFDISYKYE